MGGRPSELRKRAVEDCDVITASNHLLCDRLGIQLMAATMPGSFMSFRYWLQYPSCGRRCFKLYRPERSWQGQDWLEEAATLFVPCYRYTRD